MDDLSFLPSFWEGFVVASAALSDAGILIKLMPNAQVLPCCGQCRRPATRTHDVTVRRIRDRDCFEHRTWLDVPVRRVRCLDCGIQTEYISWLRPHARQTLRLQAHVEALCQMTTIKQTADHLGLHWHTVKEIDKRRLQREVQPPDWSTVRRLVMDEFALHKGHRYATVIIDADTLQVLWVGKGNRRMDIRPFFQMLGRHCQQIEAVAMDMNTAFDREVRQHCPSAEVVYDLFHVIAKYGREVIDRVRVDVANQLKHDRSARRFVKGSRWLLLKNRENLTETQATTLAELLAANEALALVYILKAQLKAIWQARSIWDAWLAWRQWHRLAVESQIAPLVRFARNLKPYLRGLLAHARYPLHTSCLEGINNKIKVMKRMAYGYRDEATSS